MSDGPAYEGRPQTVNIAMDDSIKNIITSWEKAVQRDGHMIYEMSAVSHSKSGYFPIGMRDNGPCSHMTGHHIYRGWRDGGSVVLPKGCRRRTTTRIMMSVNSSAARDVWGERACVHAGVTTLLVQRPEQDRTRHITFTTRKQQHHCITHTGTVSTVHIMYTW
jgi:hypothetical protein